MLLPSAAQTKKALTFTKVYTLFVLSIYDPKQNARSLFTPVSDTDFMLFHMLPLVQLSIVALSVFRLVEILQQPIRFFDLSGYQSCSGKRNRGYHEKEHQNNIRNWCQK